MKKQKTHVVDYIMLVASGVIFLLLLWVVRGQKILSLITTIIFVAFYVFWAIYHHSREEVREFKNVLEYVLIGGTILVLISIIFSFNV